MLLYHPPPATISRVLEKLLLVAIFLISAAGPFAAIGVVLWPHKFRLNSSWWALPVGTIVFLAFGLAQIYESWPSIASAASLGELGYRNILIWVAICLIAKLGSRMSEG